MDNNLVSVVKGNDFILDLYVSKYDKDQEKQVPYDVSEATDVVLRLIGNNGFIKVIRDAQPNGFKITANVDGRLRDGKYGVELLFKINNMDKRIYQANKIEILNCNCCVDAGAQTTQVIPTYDLSMYIGVDVEKINFGAVTYGNIDIDSVLSETSSNPVMNKTVTAALKEAGKIDDVLVNGESVVKDKVAEIIMPTKVSDLDNDAGYLTEHQSLADYAKISDVDSSLALKAEKSHKHNMADITDYTAPDLSPYALKETVEDNYQYAEDTYTKKEDSEVTDVSVRLLNSSVDLLYTELSAVSTTANRADTNAKNIEEILLPKKIDKGGIKTINGQSLEGTGDIVIMPGGEPVDLSDYAKKTDVDASLDLKADKTSIPTIPSFKTINGEEITGVGNIEIKSGSDPVDLTDYAKISDVDASLDLKANKAYVEELATELEDKASKTFVASNYQPIGNYITTIPTEYVTETELEGKGYLTEHQSLTAYAKISDVDSSLDLKADKTSIPTVPTKVSAFTNDAGYLTEHQSLTDYAKKTDIPVIPTKLSAFNNDEGFIKNTVTDLVNYYKKSETYTQDEVNELISKIPKFAIDVVDELPTSEISLTTVYLVKTSETADNMYTEYIYVNNVWEKLGEQKVDLTDYYTKNQIDNFLNEKADKTEIPDMKPYAKISDVDASLAKYTSTDSFNALNTEVLKKANKSYVDETFQVKGDYITEIPAEYVTETELEGKGYLTEHQSLTDYAKKTDIVTYKPGKGITINTDNTINALIGKGEGEGSLLGPNATSSTGKYNISLGYQTKATGVQGATALGYQTKASGDYSHAEGYNTTAPGVYSHVEGNGTTASNTSEHASGQFNISNKASTTFGDAGNTLFSVGNGISQNNHNAFEIRQNGDIYITDSFEGAPYKLQDKLNNCATKSDIPTIPSFKTINDEEITGTGNIEIKSDYTAGEGINITDNVISSAFFKKGTGKNSIQIIDANQASGLYSLALGLNTTASGNYSHAEGNGTVASGNYSHAEGVNTIASDNISHAEGSGSHAEGIKTTASNIAEHASGQYNISNKASDNFGDAGNTLFSVGNGKNAQNKHNAFEIRQNGDIYITDSLAGEPYKLQDKISSVKLWAGTQAEYDAIETKDDNTIYFVN